KKTKRRFLPNLHTKRFFIPEKNEWVTLKVSASAMRTIDKIGIYEFIKRQQKKGFDVGVEL
ncbi:50S ribosomal protein L28, partial [Phaeodactylibacter sp.]